MIAAALSAITSGGRALATSSGRAKMFEDKTTKFLESLKDNLLYMIGLIEYELALREHRELRNKAPK